MLSSPDPRGVARERPTLRSVSDSCGVSEYPSASDGVVECAAQDHVDLDDRLVVESSVAVGTSGVEEVGVAPFEVIGSQMP